MVKQKSESPLLVIVGETASGKSSLAIDLAERFGGEIICADSRTVYKGMDIGTAKPSAADRARVPHHGLDLVTPGERFTVADFKQYTVAAIDDITARGKLPMLVGGSGLYIDAVLYDYDFRPVADAALRQELQTLSVEELQHRLTEQGLELPANERNPRHLVRVIETGGQLATRSQLRPSTLVLGLQLDRDVLLQRITDRLAIMLADGLLEEIGRLAQQYSWDVEALQTTNYKAFRGYLEATKSLDEATADAIHNDMQLAKRQRTWFKRNKSIHWLSNRDNLAEAVDFATTFLNK